jgi:hypothetical protein
MRHLPKIPGHFHCTDCIGVFLSKVKLKVEIQTRDEDGTIWIGTKNLCPECALKYVDEKELEQLIQRKEIVVLEKT